MGFSPNLSDYVVLNHKEISYRFLSFVHSSTGSDQKSDPFFNDQIPIAQFWLPGSVGRRADL